MSERFLVLHALRLKGMASEEALADATGLDAGAVTEAVEALVTEGFAKVRTGRMPGVAITKEGRPAHAELLAEDVRDPAVQTALAAAYDGFIPVNGRFKEVCTRWQLRDGGEPNDHGDAGYDAAVIAELGAVHDDVVPLLAPAVEALPRFGRYPARMAGALERVRGGDVTAFARPLAASYHDVWMEIHEDLLVSLGRERSGSDGH